MRRVFIVVACIAAVACSGSGKNRDNNSGKLDAPISQTMGGNAVKEVESVSDNEVESSVSDICKMAEDYQEMVISAIENEDRKVFIATMERMDAWLNSLDAESRKWADAAIAAWKNNNAERMKEIYPKALTMPSVISNEAESAR
jgi:hypothetical protein